MWHIKSRWCELSYDTVWKTYYETRGENKSITQPKDLKQKINQDILLKQNDISTGESLGGIMSRPATSEHK